MPDITVGDLSEYLKDHPSQATPELLSALSDARRFSKHAAFTPIKDAGIEHDPKTDTFRFSSPQRLQQQTAAHTTVRAVYSPKPSR